MLQSYITINRHIDVAGEYANNMRLFEATGCGALLFTDNKKNLNDIFVEGKEVIAYTSSSDLIDKIQYFFSHRQEGEAIAKAGQARTLKDHTYTIRMTCALWCTGPWLVFFDSFS
jgi:spore maturation protein CgeB